MRIMILADAKSPHTVKWSNGLSDYGIEICLLSFRKAEQKYYNPDIIHISLNININKISYLKLLPIVKREIKKFKPDILHSYYASSFGFIGALSKFQPFIISMWGSDIFEFPRKSFLHKIILKYNLQKASFLQSTSKAMAAEATKYTKKPIEILPFGIDIEHFKPKMKTNNEFVIGTVKWLEDIYGINYLIDTFYLLKKMLPDKNLKLLIVGSGSKEKSYKQKVADYDIANFVEFIGAVDNKETVKYHQQMSVFVALSLQESFGVAVIEAAACGVPAVVSNVGGLPEVVENEKTGFVVEPKNPEKAAEFISKLILDKELHQRFSFNAREFVVKNYNWSENLNQQIQLYKSYINKNH